MFSYAIRIQNKTPSGKGSILYEKYIGANSFYPKLCIYSPYGKRHDGNDELQVEIRQQAEYIP